MGIMNQWFGGREGEDDMARSSTKPRDELGIEQLVDRLKHSVADANAFKATLSAIEKDKQLASAEVIDIAQKFVGGARQKSRASAISAIARRRLEISHAQAKGDLAGKTRVW